MNKPCYMNGPSDSMALCPRGSVGAILRKGSQILMLERISFPSGWACPAGHMEIDASGVRENPESALIRELREEIGIKPKVFELVFTGTLQNKCKSGYNCHEWWVYEVINWEGEPRVMEPDKHRIAEWKPSDFIALPDAKFDPAWTMIFGEIRQLKPQLIL